MRIFRIGTTEIIENDTTRDKSVEEVRAILATTYPEVKHATIRTKQEGDNTWYEFVPVAGRKG